MLKRTPLFEAHKELGARLVEFGGWEMPVQYTSIVDEHNTVRSAAGIFDISHMGEVFVTGPAAEEFLNQTLTNDIRKISPGKGQYTLMCNENSGVVDDLYVYCLGLGNYLLIVNASRIDEDFEWLQSRQSKFGRSEKVFLENKSESYGAVAVQGPKVAEFIDSCFPNDEADRPPLTAMVKNDVQMFGWNGELIHVARTGYTGEDGFEIVAPAPVVEKVWRTCLDKGQGSGIKPAGLGARDTLRTEMCYPLYGHELTAQTTPIEAGLGFFVSLEKGDFTGRSVLADQKQSGPARKMVSFKMTGKSAPPRPDYRIFSADRAEPVGQVTSGTQSPSLNLGIGLGFVPAALARPGNNLLIEVRGNHFPAVIVPKPIYKKS